MIIIDTNRGWKRPLILMNSRKEGLIQMNNFEKDQIVIRPAIARKLLRLGYEISDVRPQKQLDGSIDFTRCVFLFKGKAGLEKTIESLK